MPDETRDAEKDARSKVMHNYGLSAENDAGADYIGYRQPWPVVEHGVFEDRRGDGLGFALLKTTTGGIEHAERLLTGLKTEREYPRFIRQRVVVYEPWSRVVPPGSSDPSEAGA